MAREPLPGREGVHQHLPREEVAPAAEHVEDGPSDLGQRMRGAEEPGVAGARRAPHSSRRTSPRTILPRHSQRSVGATFFRNAARLRRQRPA
jgi:hypothetical protein